LQLTVAHGLLLGSLMAIPLALIRKPRLRLVTAAVPPIAAALVALSGWPSTGGVIAVREVPSGVMDLEVVDDKTALASLADGRVIRVDLTRGNLGWSVIGSGLENPRGIAVAGDAVYVTELGRLPCEGWCMGPEDVILREAAGRITRFRLEGDALVEPKRLVDGLPVVNYEHGVNDIDVGPGGDLFVSIGNVSGLVLDPTALAAVDHPHRDWLGTVLRIDPDNGSAAVRSRGLRNVYGLAFAPNGRLFGADNDGPTLRGWRQEELLELEDGADYGYPTSGTFDVGAVRTAPIGIVSRVGSGGIAWDSGSLLVGTEGGLERHDLVLGADGRYSSRRPTRIDVPECQYAAAVELIDSSTALVGCSNGRLEVLPIAA
jgi:Glucose / Sorbosone dehydrogenase